MGFVLLVFASVFLLSLLTISVDIDLPDSYGEQIIKSFLLSAIVTALFEALQRVL